jgi:hypothetical protein
VGGRSARKPTRHSPAAHPECHQPGRRLASLTKSWAGGSPRDARDGQHASAVCGQMQQHRRGVTQEPKSSLARMPLAWLLAVPGAVVTTVITNLIVLWGTGH